MRWNPISDSRRNSLLKWLQKQLAKRDQLRDFDWYVDQLDQSISWVDPTASGNYARWVLGLLISGKLNSTEDYEKTHELLKEFNRIKPRLPTELRNIYQYNSFSELYRTVREYLPKTLSRRELVAKGQRIIHEDPMYEIIQLTSVEAVVAASKNSGWCTCNERAARDYLEKGNLFIIYKDGERLLLAHEGSRQVMLEDNTPYTEYEPHLMELFKIYIPSLYCPKHPHGELRNKVCAMECGAAGCCDFVKCGSCSNVACEGCIKKCVTCEVGFCEDCIVEECHYADCTDGYLCGGCLEECYRCEAPMCASHKEECNICGYDFCTDCVEYCSSCNNRVCKDHWFECPGCLSEECESCAEKSNTAECPICDKVYCEGCLQHCEKCKRVVCHDCVGDDDVCSECEAEDEEDEEGDGWDEDEEDDA